MTSKDHKKHAQITKPAGGTYGRNELAVLGAPCGVIQDLSRKITDQLEGLKVGYIDADHGEGAQASVFHDLLEDKISYFQYQFTDRHIDYQKRSIFNASDLVLINGNHFRGEKQAVIIHEKKKESLQRKLDRLTNVRFFILDEGQHDIWDYLKEHNPDFDKLPKIKIGDIRAMADAVRQLVTVPPLKGLVLAGGKSTRMGHDKGAIEYYGKPHREYLADLISAYTEETFISVRGEGDIETHYAQLPDTFTGLGPYGGILSAFRYDPNAAWLIVATDIPLLDDKTLRYLIENRDTSTFATCFHNPETNFPEPLITIWEPRGYPRLLNFLALGYTCPRKALINTDIREIFLDDSTVLTNVNTPEEKQSVMEKLK